MINKEASEVLVNLTNVAVGLSIVIVNWSKVNNKTHEGANETLRYITSEIKSYIKKD